MIGFFILGLLYNPLGGSEKVPALAVELQVVEHQDNCGVRLEGGAYELPRDQERLRSSLNALGSRGVEVHVVAVSTEEVSYRCFGNVILVTQRARVRVALISGNVPLSD